MHSSIRLRIEFKNRFVIPYIKDYDKKNTLISYSLRISIISKSIKFYGLLQLILELLVLVLTYMHMGSKGKDVDNWQEEGPLDDIASYVPVISS